MIARVKPRPGSRVWPGFFRARDGPDPVKGNTAMPKINIYPNPWPNPSVVDGSVDPSWDEDGARRRIEVGYSTDSVQLATTQLRPGADRHQDYSPADEGPEVPYTPSWDGWFIDLDRQRINDLIRALRTARDKAFGADE